MQQLLLYLKWFLSCFVYIFISESETESFFTNGRKTISSIMSWVRIKYILASTFYSYIKGLIFSMKV